MATATHNPDDFFALARSPKLSLFLLRQLPAAWFSGLCVTAIDGASCTVRVPYRWFTRNPFGSTYFACLAMAGEMSTGLLAMAHIYRRKPGVSMLVTAMDARFYKKAKGATFFACADGHAIRAAIEAAVETGLPQSVKARATGVNEAGEAVADFSLEWGFKRR